MMGHDRICPICMLMYMYHIFFTDVYWYKEHTIYLNSGSFLASSLFQAVFVFKGAVSRNSAKLGNYKMPVKLRETHHQHCYLWAGFVT